MEWNGKAMKGMAWQGKSKKENSRHGMAWHGK
jgi:hypothetical protein